MKKRKISSEFVYFTGAIILAFATALLTASDLGLSMVIAPAYIVSLKFDFLTFGQAEDIVQDVFLKLWERRELLDNISLTSFLFMMVRNSCLNYLKHRQIADSVQQRIPDAETAERLYAADFVPDPSSLLIQKELSDSIDQIMEELPPKCKEAFVLSRLNGLKNREIAEHMAITEKVVEKHITRALKRFRDGLRRYALLLGTLLSLWKW